jgi:hypothetical protein
MIQGSLSLRAGVLYVARHEQTAHVRPYDLDGRALGPGFSFRSPSGEPIALGGIDVDADRRIWIADTSNASVRAFSVFGREAGGFASSSGLREDARGSLWSATDLAIRENDERRDVIVASGGWRRHGLQVYREDGSFVDSLRPDGSPLAKFSGLTRIGALGRWIFACETVAGRVQVFRDDDFHFAFRIPTRAGVRFEPVAVAPLDDGSAVLATRGSESALFLVDSAGRLKKVLAERGSEHGQVDEPGDVVIEQNKDRAVARIAVIDRDAERVQVFTLDGRCHGELGELPGHAIGDLE